MMESTRPDSTAGYRARSDTQLVIRRGEPEDAVACHQLLWEAATDLGDRRGTPLPGTAEEWWRSSEPLHRYLASHAAEWWVAEEPHLRELIGYARSIARDGLVELTEFFVRPGQQARGVGRALLERTFPIREGGDLRTIIATTDGRALARYYAAGTVVRFPMFTLAGKPKAIEHLSLTATQLGKDDDAVTSVAAIERSVLGFPRGSEEFKWLLDQREGYVYNHNGTVVGFAFVGPDGVGPIASLEPSHLPDMLLHIEDRARTIGLERLEFEVPALNAVAIRHLLGRGFHIDPWINLLMSSQPFGQFDRFLGYSPPIFL